MIKIITSRNAEVIRIIGTGKITFNVVINVVMTPKTLILLKA